MPGRIRSVIHIKNRTAGTSNELSFDVLEAKKVEADSASRSERTIGSRRASGWFERKKRREARSSVAGSDSPSTMPKLYTNDAALAAKNIERANLPYSDPAAEITRRKRRRTRAKVVSVLAGVAIVGAIGIVTYTEFNRYMADQNQMVAMLSEALQTIESTDEAVVAMDELVMKPIDEQDVEKLDEISASLSDVSEQLDTAYTQAQQVSDHIVNSRDREASNQALSAISARQEMIRNGSLLIEEGKTAQQAADNMSQAWNLILEADTLTQNAGRLVTETTEENVTESMDQTNQAIDKFKEARELVDWVAEHYPAADVSNYLTYIDKRIEGQEAALESDAAMLLMDRGTAEEKNQVLYGCDDEAAQIAQEFPEDPSQQVLDAYQESSKSLREKYLQARSQAASADSYLRDYVKEYNK